MLQMLNGQLFQGGFYGGLGADATYPLHSEVPYRSKPVYLRLTNSIAKAMDYAAAGYHVSVSRGVGGGCGGSSDSVDGTDESAVCDLPLGRDDLSALWAQAAAGYKSAFDLASNGGSLADVKTQLGAANNDANVAYHSEGVDPPSDPVQVAANAAAGLPPPAPEGAAAASMSSGHPLLWGLLGVGIATGLGIAIYKGAKARTKRKSKRAYEYAY